MKDRGLKYIASSSKATRVPSSDVGECAEAIRRGAGWYTSGRNSAGVSPSLYRDRTRDDRLSEGCLDGNGSDRVSVHIELVSCVLRRA